MCEKVTPCAVAVRAAVRLTARSPADVIHPGRAAMLRGVTSWALSWITRPFVAGYGLVGSTAKIRGGTTKVCEVASYSPESRRSTLPLPSTSTSSRYAYCEPPLTSPAARDLLAGADRLVVDGSTVH